MMRLQRCDAALDALERPIEIEPFAGGELFER